MAEILAPAGSPAQLTAAVNAGADAVYMGAKGFNARAYAANFTDDGAREAINYAHENGVRVYAALNTLVTDKELRGALAAAYEMEDCGVDAFIIQDMGLARLLRKRIKSVRLHASTQMSVLCSEDALRLRDMGIERVILGRELSLEEIEKIKKRTGMEIEVFVHGSLCMSVSGQCFFSSVLGQRSGNRGRCAQQCRQRYMVDNRWSSPLSLKDLYSGEYIEKLENAGVDSFKIEGRMKRPEYVYEAVRAYKGRDFSCGTEKRLMSLFSRQGFTDGYLKGEVGSHMIGFREARQIADSAVASKSVDMSQKLFLKSPVTPEKHEVTPFCYKVRRQSPEKNSPEIWVSFESPAQLPFDMSKFDADRIFVGFEELCKNSHRADLSKVGVVLPFPVFEKDREDYLEKLGGLAERGLRFALCNSVSQLEDVKKLEITPIADFRTNIFNSSSLEGYEKFGAQEAVLSFELSFPQIRDINKTVPCGIVGYGRLPLMVTRNCIVKNSDHCGNCNGSFTITNEKGEKFAPVKNYGCGNIILNSRPLYVGDLKDISSIGISFVLLRFTLESEGEAARVLRDFKAKKPPCGNFTRGLYTKGVL